MGRELGTQADGLFLLEMTELLKDHRKRWAVLRINGDIGEAYGRISIENERVLSTYRAVAQAPSAHWLTTAYAARMRAEILPIQALLLTVVDSFG